MVGQLRRWWLLAIGFVYALSLRLYRLDAQSLWLDEGGTWAEITGRTGKGWLALTTELFSPDAGYPLYHLLLKLWITIAGDSAWALRFPSALFGALAAMLLSHLLASPSDRPTPSLVLFGLLIIASPYALWHAQDAKAYSLLFFVLTMLIWRLIALLASPTRQNWLLLAATAVTALFVHRLALFAVAASLLVLALRMPLPSWPRIGLLAATLLGSIAGLSGTLRAAAAERAFIDRSGAGPLEALWLSFVRFSLDRTPGDLQGYLGLPLLIWLLPSLCLFGWGLYWVLKDATQGDPRATSIACLTLLPLALLLVLVAFAPVYEPRYAMIAFPGWVLISGYGLVHPHSTGQRGQPATWLIPAIATLALIGQIGVLFQPNKGLYSGDPLKEQWREAVIDLADRIHPDDLLLIHPSYVAVMYDYYATRVGPDPLPTAITFPVFAEGDTCGETTPAAVRACWQRRYEPFFNAQAQGRKRALLLIAPDHARTVDPPKSLAELQAEAPANQPLPMSGDRYGWVGLRFQYPQKTWPCGGTGDALIGVEVMCQSFPESFQAGGAGSIPQPSTASDVVFDNTIRLRGYTLAPHADRFVAGGRLPITLYWSAVVPPSSNYRLFLHLCQDCESPPVANDDGPPLGGYPPAGLTSTWQVGDPLHDERVLRLPATLAPGTYTLLIGMTRDGQRVPINGQPQLANQRLILTTIEVQPTPSSAR
ncbi:MAG: glycosyltransferase family 39 protein [Roseiflexaceae bacterium]